MSRKHVFFSGRNERFWKCIWWDDCNKYTWEINCSFFNFFNKKKTYVLSIMH